MEKLLDLYTDYLLSTFNQATATGLSELSEGSVSHDQVSRLLSRNTFSSKELWLKVKPLVKKHQSESGCVIFDDTIIEKMYMGENPLVCWHWDHSQGKAIKGINLLSAFYHSGSTEKKPPLRIPVAFDLVLKTKVITDPKTGKQKRKSEVTKNEMMRTMLAQLIHNQLKFSYVLADSWFASSDNMRFIHRKKKFFIFDMKSNRSAALNEADRNEGRWTRIDQLDIPDNTSVQVWLKDLEIPVVLTKQVFTNQDQSTGVRFLVSNDLSLPDDRFTTLFKKRWGVEEYHKSLKQNAAIGKSPTRTVKTQNNHLFAAILAYVKLEQLKFTTHLNHFAMKSKLYLAAIKAAFKELELLKQAQPTAA